MARMQASFLIGYSCRKVIHLRLIALERYFCQASFNKQKSQARHTYKVSCLLLPSQALFGLSTHPCWYLFFAIFVNWESMGKLFKIRIICVERIIFKIRIICVECIIFKIRIICVERIIFKIQIICGLDHDG
jgi:hypothetical protein